MKRVVITGIGVLSPIGNDANSISDSLLNGKSGLILNQDFIDNGMRCHVSGNISADIDQIYKRLRFINE